MGEKLQEKVSDLPLSLRMMSVKQVMEALRVSKPTVYMLFRTKALKSVKVGRHRKVRASDLDAYLTSVEVK